MRDFLFGLVVIAGLGTLVAIYGLLLLIVRRVRRRRTRSAPTPDHLAIPTAHRRKHPEIWS